MEALAEYLLGVIAASLICGIVSSLCPSALMKFLCGVFLAVTVLSPLKKVDVETYFSRHLLPMEQAEFLTGRAEEEADAAWRHGIKEALEAYILDKAPDLKVTVKLSEGELPVPVEITLQGNLSPAQREALANTVTEDLGIPEEAQHWIG